MQTQVHREADHTFRPLWRLQRQGHDASCEIVVLPFGFEGRFLLDGTFLYSYTFTRPGDAVEWAGQKERQFRRDGWAPEL